MSVEPVTKAARNPWKIATIVLAVLMGLGLVLTAIGAAVALHRDGSGYGTRNGRPCMGSGCDMGGGKGNMGSGKGGMGMGQGKGSGRGNWGPGGMGQGYGPVIVQQGGPVVSGGEACTKVANADGSVSVICTVNQNGMPTPMPMPTAMPMPNTDVTPVVIGSGPVVDVSPGGELTPVVVSNMGPADATPGETVSYQVTVNQAPGGEPAYRFCTFDGTTLTCSDGTGAQPAPMDQQCRTENGSTMCWGTSYGTSQGSWDGYGYKGSTRMMMPGMGLLAGGLFVTFLTALAALILAILAFRRKRSRPAPVAAVTPPAQPVVVADAAAADLAKAEPVVAPLTEAAATDPVKTQPVVVPAADASAAEPVKAEVVVTPITESAPAPAPAPKVRRTRR